MFHNVTTIWSAIERYDLMLKLWFASEKDIVRNVVTQTAVALIRLFQRLVLSIEFPSHSGMRGSASLELRETGRK